jgi:DNA gyrase subunit A
MGEITKMDIVDAQQDNMLKYFLSIMYDRAIADVKDGLKPIHRKILWSMYEQGIFYNKKKVKCANVVGGVLAKFSPHGDASAYEALVRLSQPWSVSIPCIDFQGKIICRLR